MSTERFQLSPQQRRLWPFLAAGETGAFRAVGRVSVRGRLEAALVEEALGRVVQKYEILRTTFDDEGGGEPMQVVHDRGDVALRHEVRCMPATAPVAPADSREGV